MSRRYRMTIYVEGYTALYESAIVQAIHAEWPIDEQGFRKGGMTLEGDSTLNNGKTEDVFADDMAQAVMEANHGPCFVLVAAALLEDPPSNLHRRDKEDYARLMNRAPRRRQ